MYRESRSKPLNLNLLWSLNLLLAEQSVTTAAERAGITQSAMSHTLKQLREYFQDELLVKGERGLVLTPKAEKMSGRLQQGLDRKSTRLNSSHDQISYAVFCLKKKKKKKTAIW